MPGSLQILMLIIGIFVIVLTSISLIILLGIKKKPEENHNLKNMQYIQNSFSNLGEMLMGSQRQATEIQDKRLQELNFQLTQRNDTLQKTVFDALAQIDTRLKDNSIVSEQKLEQIRQTMEKRITLMQDENSKKLDEMRATVDEKLQKTLEDRIGKSFQLVSERLEQVYKGLGEMQNLAAGVGDLKKVLSNVKTRGILGEIQLEAILEQILSPDQYEKNVAIKKGSQERVEFAVKLPGDGEGEVYLPIDAKFPVDTYTKLVEAYDAGIPAEVNQVSKMLERAIKTFAKSIHDKYIHPPQTTDFGMH
jgi:DNA recombination protein RmuC